MNKTPNPNYPLPEKWYVQRTKKNAEKLNLILNIVDNYNNWFLDNEEIILKKLNPERLVKGYFSQLDGYTEVTYEDLWLAYIIPEKWYCLDTPVELLNRWRTLNGITDSNVNCSFITLSEHQYDGSYFWGGNVLKLKNTKYYKDYKEISLEDLRMLLNILEQNTKPMENNTPGEVIIPIGEFVKIVNVACPNWQKKLRDYMIDNLQDDCFSIKVTKNFYDRMIAAATTRNGVNQADVINEVLPMFKHDPYKVFRDAEKEGKVVQFLGDSGKWLSKFTNWSYNHPPERYRIKHKHQDLIDEWEASGRTKAVESKIPGGVWRNTEDPWWNEEVEYRFKPEPEYVAFNDSEIRQLMGEWIKHKVTGEMTMITEVYPPSHGGGITVKVVGGRTSLNVIFDQYTFLDCSPCGKLVTE